MVLMLTTHRRTDLFDRTFSEIRTKTFPQANAGAEKHQINNRSYAKIAAFGE
jgi:hypothetical protein